MFSKFKKSTLLQNIVSLTILNGLNLVLPLVTIPYLIATVGSANYGAYSISYSIVQYVLMVSTFGFSYISTKQIAQKKDSLTEVSRIFYATIYAKILLALVASVICFGFVYFFFPKYMRMYLLGLGIVVGDIFNVVWLFQGMENMKYTTITNGIAKLLFTLLIFICIRHESDYQWIIVLNAIGFLMGGIISFIIAHKIFHITFLHVSFQEVITQIRESSTVFFSSAFVNLFNNSFVVIIGLFLSESMVGVYAAVDKIIKAAKLVIDPISNALFPHVARNFVGHTNQENVTMLFSYAKKIFFLLLAITAALFIFSPLICRWFLPSISEESAYLLRLMSPLVILGGMNYLLGMVGLITLGAQKIWLKILFIGTVSGTILLLVTVHWWGITSTAISQMTIEGISLILCIYHLYKLTHTPL